MRHASASQDRRWRILLSVATAAYALAGVATMFALSPRVPYADPWRFMAHFLTTPWPWNVLAADNGHRELFPNLVRVLELEWLQSSQWLQITVGAVLACATVAVLAHGIRREPAGIATRAATLFFAVAGIFWLGNERALAHGNESVHAYLVTLCLAAGCWLSADGSPVGASRRLAAVVLLGTVATFSFGSGIACFSGFAVVMLLRRASWRSLAVILAAGITVAALHLALGNAGAGTAAGLPSPTQGLRWLSAPFVYAAWPLLDANAAAQVPVAPVREACLWFSRGFTSVFGPVQTAAWPGALIGLAGVGWLLWSTLGAWQRAATSRMQRVALGIAWFALMVGALVCLSRADYFIEHPQQVVAPRYVPWSSLFWSGLAMSTALGTRQPEGRRVAAWALLVAAVLAPSQFWMAMLAQRTQSLAEFNAVGVAVGVLGEETELGENVLYELATARPLLMQSGQAMFGWPESQALGRALPADAVALPVRGLRLLPVANRLGTPGQAVYFELERAPCRRLLLADARGSAIGMAIRRGGGARWQGWARGAAAGSRIFAICGVGRAARNGAG